MLPDENPDSMKQFALLETGVFAAQDRNDLRVPNNLFAISQPLAERRAQPGILLPRTIFRQMV